MGARPLPERLRGFARRVRISSALRSMLRRLGFDLVRRHYYSPIPDIAELPPETWARESDLRGLRFDVDAGLDFVNHELATYVTEYLPPTAPTAKARDFYLDNGFYESVDAETLYAMVRRFAPPRIIELGSGLSTLVIADARARNEHSDDSRHIVYDPYPRPELMAILQSVADVRSVAATDVPLGEFAQLRSGDLLFVDTTHTVKTGGDVNRVILDVLPSLAPGVLIHFHDIFLPWEYPTHFSRDRNFFWAEQYLLQAFLAYNQEYEVLFSAHAVQRRFPDAVSRLVASAGPDVCPSAFWLRRVER